VQAVGEPTGINADPGHQWQAGPRQDPSAGGRQRRCSSILPGRWHPAGGGSEAGRQAGRSQVAGRQALPFLPGRQCRWQWQVRWQNGRQVQSQAGGSRQAGAGTVPGT